MGSDQYSTPPGIAHPHLCPGRHAAYYRSRFKLSSGKAVTADASITRNKKKNYLQYKQDRVACATTGGYITVADPGRHMASKAEQQP